MKKHCALFVLPVTLSLMLPLFSRGEVILQYFEADWEEIYARLPEIGEIGYDGMWIPSPCKSPVSGDIPWANVGYSLYDRFDLGDIPQRGTLKTRYGTRGELRNMVDAAHRSDVKIYPDVVFNHNGNGPNIYTYPGMSINDFHAWPDGSQPGGWRRAPRMTGYDDISNGNGQTFQQELVSLIDIVTEPDGRFGVPEPSPYVRHPGEFEKYPFHNPGSALPNENVREMLARWAHWLGNAMDYDGFRLDAAKHVVHEFYGPRGSGFLHEAQFNYDQRRGFTYDAAVPTLYQNEVRRSDMLMFAEIFTGGTGTFDYWRNGDVRMRYLDFPLKQSVIGDAFSNGNLGALASIGVSLDPTEGVFFAQSHDQNGPGKLELAYAWLLTHVGVPVVYFSGNNINDTDHGTRTWVLPGFGPALGDYNGVIPNLVYIHNNFARGREWGRWNENDYFAFERYTDQNTNQNPDNGEATLIVALNDSGFDQTRTFPTSFPDGTQLKDYTGNNGNDVTVSGGQVSVTVPGRGGQGFVCYAPYNADASGDPLRFSNAGSMDWIVPGGRDAADKPRTITRITGNTSDIDIHVTTPLNGTVADVVVKWGQGMDLNASATDFGGADVVKGGFEQATEITPGQWRLSADLSNVPEGLHTIKGRVFNDRFGLSAIFQTFSETVYVDRAGPGFTIDNLVPSELIIGERIIEVSNPDFTAGDMEWRIDAGAWQPAHKVMRGSWKFALNGLANGAYNLDVRAKEYDLGSPANQINASTNSVGFLVTVPDPNFAINHAEGATITLPFFKTELTSTNGSTSLHWDGYELDGLVNDEHFFNGRYISGGSVETLYGAFVNGPHFLEAHQVVGGVTQTVARSVQFNLYGSNQIDSDGDGLPDDVELPGFSGGLPPANIHPGDNNQDMIPNYGENWGRLNPINHDTFYNGTWDGDEDWDNDGYGNLCEVWQGYIEHGNPYHYDIYNGGSKPSTCGSTVNIPAQISWAPQTPTDCSGSTVTIEYAPNQGPLETESPINVGILGVGSTVMQETAPGQWAYTYPIPSNTTAVTFWFHNDAMTVFDNNGNANYSLSVNTCVAGGGPVFNMDGLYDSPNYLVSDNGMRIYTACKDQQLYIATWSAIGGGSDHFVLVTDTFDPSEPAPWGKAGVVYLNKSTKPYLAGESNGGYNTLANGGTNSRSTHGSGGNALEGEFNLVEVFGYMPEYVYLTAVAYGTSDGGTVGSQAPAVWNSDNDIQVTEMQAIKLDAVRDDDLNGHFDGGLPTMETEVGGNTRDANYDLRRFFINELAGESYAMTVRLYPNVGSGDAVSDVQLFSNINRRDFAVLEEDPDLVTASSPNSYFKAYPMSPIVGDGYEVTVPVNRCGAYRINARYRVNGGGWVYYTDNGLRKDCAVVITPTKALEITMYEVNPSVVEATTTDLAGRSTFRDLYLANTNKPDYVNTAHYDALGMNMLWLQPIHPIGVDGRDINPDTGLPFDPGSPYAVRDYWTVNPILGSDNTEASAMNEFRDFVNALDATGVGVMMDGTFNHSAPDAILGQGAADIFSWVGSPTDKIRDVRVEWFAKAGRPGEHATYYQTAQDNDISLAPDRIDFGKFTDVREFFFGSYDSLVKGVTDNHREEFLSEQDLFYGHDNFTREVWEFFAYYPIFWLEQTGHPAGTPKSESFKGIDGLRCDFAQGLPSQFWEYCINKTRNVKWDFLFMAESLDGSREINGSRRHGIGYRSARHFDILNENFVFYWRNAFFSYPYQGPGGPNDPSTPNPNTGATFGALDQRINAFDASPLLLNLTSHDEVFPSDDPFSLLYAYTQLSAISGVPMVFYGQEAGALNDANTQAGVFNTDHNFALYENNFGKSIPNFKVYNHMQNVWQNRDFNLQNLYGRIGQARLASPALQSPNNYFLNRPGGPAFNPDPDIFAVAKVEEPGVSAADQEVIFAFVNNNYQGSANRSALFDLDVDAGGNNYFGIIPGHNYNIVDLLSANPTNHIWNPDMTGANLISNGIFVGLNDPATSLGQAQYLKLIDTAATPSDNDLDGLSDFSDWDDDNDLLPDDWELIFGLDPLSAAGADGAMFDIDGDGLYNIDEYRAGTNPNDPTSTLALTIDQDIPNALLDVRWRTVPGRNYRLHRTLDLNNPDWTQVFFGTAVAVEGQMLDGIPADDDRYYYQVEAVE